MIEFAVSSAQVAAKSVNDIMSQVMQQIDNRFVLETSYKYTSSKCMVKMRHITSTESMNQLPIYIKQDKQPKPLIHDSNMTPPLSQAKTQQAYNNLINAMSLKSSTSIKQSKTLTATQFKKFQRFKYEEDQNNQNLQYLNSENPQQGYINGLRQLKREQIKSIAKPTPNLLKLKRKLDEQIAYDYNGNILKLKSPESTHIIRTQIETTLKKIQKPQTSRLGKRSSSHQPLEKNFQIIFNNRQKVPNKEDPGLSGYVRSNNFESLELKEGVKLILEDGHIIQNKKQQSNKDLVIVNQRFIKKKDSELKTTNGKYQITKDSSLGLIRKTLSVKTFLQKNMITRQNNTQRQLELIKRKVQQKLIISSKTKSISKSQVTSNVQTNALPVLPLSKPSRHQSLLRTRRESKNLKDLLQNRNKKFEQNLRTIS